MADDRPEDIELSSDLSRAKRHLGFEPQFWSPQDYAAFLADEMRRWPPLVKAAGIKPE